MKEFRIGAIGAGCSSARYLRALKPSSSVQLAGIADLYLARAQTAAKAFTLPAAHSNPEELFVVDALVIDDQSVHFSTAVEMGASR
jgi:predicted dehydrogenase